MDGVCVDCLWCIVSSLDGRDIMTCRLVNRTLCEAIDAVSQAEWRLLYAKRIGDALCVRKSFDWKRATLVATTHNVSVNALCMWNFRRVAIVAPWECPSLTFDEAQGALFHMRLRSGVSRGVVAETSVVDFVYNKMLRLRGCQRSCSHRNASHPCTRCQGRERRRCLNPQYEYYIRPTKDADRIAIDECLALLLTPHSNI